MNGIAKNDSASVVKEVESKDDLENVQKIVKRPELSVGPITNTPVMDEPKTKAPVGDFGEYRDSNFDWKNRDEWEWADGSPMHDGASLFHGNSITVNRDIRNTPFRTRRGWSGKKVVYFEWITHSVSDTNIWMLNTKISPQFGSTMWPHYGELDLFEMFNQDEIERPGTGYHNGFRQFHEIDSYGATTFHTGVYGNRCNCPSSHSKQHWYRNQPGKPSACSAQHANRRNQVNRMAAIFNYGHGGQYIQIVQDPILITRRDNTMDIQVPANAVPPFVNNHDLFWGIPRGQCNHGGHNPSTGFPFFEDFRFIVQEQMPGGSFELVNFKVFLPQN